MLRIPNNTLDDVFFRYANFVGIFTGAFIIGTGHFIVGGIIAFINSYINGQINKRYNQLLENQKKGGSEK